MKKAVKIMALETSAPLGSVALGEDSQVLREKELTAEQQHAAELLPAMEAIVREQGWQVGDLDHLYVSAGPGSFTGLRIGITAAKVLGWAQLTRLVAVVSTDAAVLNVDEAVGGQEVRYGVVVIDAKRKGVYAAVYERVAKDGMANSYIPGWRCVLEPRIMTAAELMTGNYRPMHILGDGLKVHREVLTGEAVVPLAQRHWPPRARNVLRCGWLRAKAGLFVTPEELLPIYLRRPEAVERWQEKHG